jgi:hypothetical protein
MFLCLWHVHKAWVENVIKRIISAEERARILFALGSIMYFQDSPLHVKHVFWIEQQLELLVTNYLDSAHF